MKRVRFLLVAALAAAYLIWRSKQQEARRIAETWAAETDRLDG